MLSDVTVTGLGGADKVAFLAESRAASFAGAWAVNHAAGANETLVSVNSPEASDAMAISCNSTATTGADKLEDFVLHNAQTVEILSRGGLVNASGTVLGGSELDSLVFKLEGDGPRVAESFIEGGPSPRSRAFLLIPRAPQTQRRPVMV